MRLQPLSRASDDTGAYYTLGFVAGKSVRIEAEPAEPTEGAPAAFGGQARNGEWFLLPPGCRFTATNDRTLPVELALVRFRASEAPIAQGERLLTLRQPRARERADAFLAAPAAADMPTAVYYRLQASLHATMAEFAEAVAAPEVGDGGKVGGEEELLRKIERVRRQLVEQFDKHVDADELARQTGLSSSRFYRAFRQHTGFPPHKYVMERRLSASLALLANAPASIMEAAHAVGYGDELYFSRLFKKHMGLTPSEFAARANKRIANLCPVFEGDLAALGIAPALSLPRGWSDEPERHLRRIEETRPELILTYPVPEDVYRALAAIAPTHMLKWKGWPWKERLLYIAEALDIPTVARRWLRRFEEKASNARRLIAEKFQGEPFVVISVYGGGWYRLYGLQRKKMKDLFYDELGFAAPETVREIGFLDTERLADAADLDCDNVVFLVPDSLPEEVDLQLERMWRAERKRAASQPACLVVRHTDPLLYSAAFHEALIDQTVHRLHSLERS